ncbi:TPA: hypothetical protein ACHKWI_004972, partial [Escherichia coli]
KKLIQNSILTPIKTTIFLSVFLCIFGVLSCCCGLWLAFCVVIIIYNGHKDRENNIFQNKTP